MRNLGAAAVPVAMFAVILAVFSSLEPASFPTLANANSILDQATELAVMTAGLTIVLIVGEFDLSFAANIGLSGAAAVLVMRDQHQSALVAVLVALLVGTVIGFINGVLVAYLGVSAFIGTLAVSSMALGADAGLTDNQSIYEGVTTGYQNITTDAFLNIRATVWIGALFTLVIWLFLRFHKVGRYLHAVGDSELAARLAGVDTRRVRLFAFMIVGFTSGLVAVIVTSRAGSTFPQSGTSYLLAAYAAAFLGASVLPRRQFHPLAGLFGVLFLATLTTGLIMVQAASWTVDLLQGIVLAVAVMVGRIRQGR
jgi:ribose/xylose/arabinose/galactoside ABC-type transport system permease subunit